MSADNFVHIKEFEDGFYYVDLSASAYWDVQDWNNINVPDKHYQFGPFETYEEAYDDADEHFVEYGIFTNCLNNLALPPIKHE